MHKRGAGSGAEKQTCGIKAMQVTVRKEDFPFPLRSHFGSIWKEPSQALPCLLLPPKREVKGKGWGKGDGERP